MTRLRSPGDLLLPDVPASSIEVFIEMDRLGAGKVPFLFIIDFELRKPLVIPQNKVDPGVIQYDFRGSGNSTTRIYPPTPLHITKHPVSMERFGRAFDKVLAHEKSGNSFLVNLTFRTEISIDPGLEELYYRSSAPYKLWWRDRLAVFSPESFIRIEKGLISAFPMKGTIDAGLPDAANRILSDSKELAEHVTIVDLIRNDLSRVAREVAVTRFRYIDEITTTQKSLLQVSSRIEGRLEAGYEGQIGQILLALLPAGSVSGAPKAKTLEIIREAEEESRGYYCGVMGFFDGCNLDSAVMIRYIEQDDGRHWYRSGGGITVNSNMVSEYQEMIDKIYVPVD